MMLLWKAIYPFVDPVTRDKVAFVPSGTPGWPGRSPGDENRGRPEGRTVGASPRRAAAEEDEAPASATPPTLATAPPPALSRAAERAARRGERRDAERERALSPHFRTELLDVTLGGGSDWYGSWASLPRPGGAGGGGGRGRRGGPPPRAGGGGGGGDQGRGCDGLW